MGKLTGASDLTNVILIGDVNDNLLHSLLRNESSVLQQRNELLLDTKYYVVRLKLVSLKTVEMINEWRTSSVNVNVGAVLYKYDGEFSSMELLQQQTSTWKAEIQVAVCKRLDRSAEWSEILHRFCAGKQIELVELDPDAETIQELNEFHELYGVPRIWQILEAGNWGGKTMKMNPLELNERRNFEKVGLPISNTITNSSGDSFDDEEFEAEDYHMTDKDREAILKLFGMPKVSFDSLMKDLDVPDLAVIEYFKQEAEKLKPRNKLAANKTRKKKKSKVAAVNEFGGFVSATSSEQMFSDVSTQNSLNLDLPSNEHRDSDVNVHKKQELSDDICKVFPEKCKKGSHELSNASRSMIDELFDKSAEEQDANLVNKIHAVRSALLKMPFGPERQNLAADTMAAVIKSIGDSDLFNSSSDDEPHT